MSDMKQLSDEELLEQATPLSDDELLAAAVPMPKPRQKPGIGDKLLKPAVDAVTGLAGMPVDMYSVAMQIDDMKNQFAANVGNMLLSKLGFDEKIKATNRLPEEPLPGSSVWMREQLPEEWRGAPAETAPGRAAQEIATFAGENVLTGGLGGLSRAGLRAATTSAALPAVASSLAGEVDDRLRFPAVMATELVRGKTAGLRRRAGDAKRVHDEGGRSWREADLEAQGRIGAGKMIDEALGPNSVDQLDEGINARNVIRLDAPDFSPTTAAVTNNQKLAMTERAMDSGLHGQPSGSVTLPDAKNEFFLQRQRSNKAVVDAVDRLLAPERGNPADLQRFAQQQLDDAAAAHRAALDALDYTPTPAGTPEDLGTNMRRYVIQNWERGRAQANRLYDARVDAYGTEPVNGVGRMIDVLLSERTLDEHITQRLQGHQQAMAAKRAEHIDPLLDTMYASFTREIDNAVNQRLMGMTDEAAAAARPALTQRFTEEMRIPYAHAVRYHQELGAAANKARVAGASDKARRLERADEALRDIMATGVANPTLREGLQTANAFYRDLINRFSVRGQPGMFARGRAPNSPDAFLVNSGKLVDKMFVKGEAGYNVADQTARALQTIDENTGLWVTDPARLSDYQNAVFDQAVRATYDIGSVSKGQRPSLPSDNLAKFIDDHQDAFRHPINAPVLNRLATLRVMREGLERRAAQAGVAAEDIAQTVVGRMFDLDDSKAVAKFLNSTPARRAQAMQMLEGDRAAQNALRSMVLDSFVDKSSSTSNPLGYDHRLMRADDMLKKFKENEKALEGLFDRQHVRDARQMLEGMAKMESARVDPTRGSQTATLTSYQEAIKRKESKDTLLGGKGRHAVNIGFGILGTQMATPAFGMVLGGAAGMAAGAASTAVSRRLVRMYDVSRATMLGKMKDAIADPEQARAFVQFLHGQPESIPLVRNYLWASGDLATRNEPKRTDREEQTANPSEGFDDELIADFGAFSNPQPPPPPGNRAQVQAAETKRIQAAERGVKTARSGSMTAPKVAQEMRSKGLSISDIQKKSEESRRKPFEDLVQRASSDLPRLLATLEALKPNERDLVRDLAEPALNKLIEAEKDDMSAADAMARAEELFAPPAEEGAGAAAL